jgi:Icc-related predicted phosphoesterase
MTHGPPLGILDANNYDDPCGCTDLLREVEQRVRPRVHIFGHIHEGYGECDVM